MPVDYRLNAIVDAEQLADSELPAYAHIAASHGATLIQYRDKQGSTRQLIERAKAIANGLRGTGVPFVVNDRVDVALATGAAGVHLGRADMGAATARRLLGPEAIIGLTVKCAEDAAVAITAPIDYACIGGVFATASKDNPDPPVGLEGLADLVATIRASRPDLPVGAIAGITRENLADAMRTGISGVAVIGAILRAGDPAEATMVLRAAVDAEIAVRNTQEARR
jgi:thiamine-phosphate pyrophosphorylase